MSVKRLKLYEHRWLTEAGYTIREHWIGPFEGYEYTLCRTGYSSRDALVTRKSERACYNQAKRLAAAQ